MVFEAILGHHADLVRQPIYRQQPSQSPNHPAGWLARDVLDATWSTCQAEANGAAMAIELVDGALAPYEAALRAGERLPGTRNWPVPFIMC